MARFVLRQRTRPSGAPEHLVVDSEDNSKPVASFDDGEAARAHADKLNAGPLDWDDQEQWQDSWDDWGGDGAA